MPVNATSETGHYGRHCIPPPAAPCPAFYESTELGRRRLKRMRQEVIEIAEKGRQRLEAGLRDLPERATTPQEPAKPEVEESGSDTEKSRDSVTEHESQAARFLGLTVEELRSIRGWVEFKRNQNR